MPISKKEYLKAKGYLEATTFEDGHQMLLHWSIVGLSFLTYLGSSDDVVWRFVRNHGEQTRPLEHILFLIATLLIGAGAYLCTASRNSRSPLIHYWGEFVYAVGLASLFPLAGYMILVMGEAARLLRLGIRNNEFETWQQIPGYDSSTQSRSAIFSARVMESSAVRLEALKWCLFVTMIVFTVTLKDQFADLLICASIFFAVLLNWRTIKHHFMAA